MRLSKLFRLELLLEVLVLLLVLILVLVALALLLLLLLLLLTVFFWLRARIGRLIEQVLAISTDVDAANALAADDATVISVAVRDYVVASGFSVWLGSKYEIVEVVFVSRVVREASHFC